LHLDGRALPARQLQEGGDGAGVVGGELQADHRVVVHQVLGAFPVADVDVVLVREHRVGLSTVRVTASEAVSNFVLLGTRKFRSNSARN